MSAFLYQAGSNKAGPLPFDEAFALNDCRDVAPEQRGQATQVRIEALQLLAPFLALPADMAGRVHAAVERVVSDFFPTFSQVSCQCGGVTLHWEIKEHLKQCIPGAHNLLVGMHLARHLTVAYER